MGETQTRVVRLEGILSSWPHIAVSVQLRVISAKPENCELKVLLLAAMPMYHLTAVLSILDLSYIFAKSNYCIPLQNRIVSDREILMM